MSNTSTSPGETESKIVIDFPSPLVPVTKVRSTLITSSLTSLRARGLFPRYDAAQRSVHRNLILSCVAGEWLDLEVARAHYETCEALGLTPEEQYAIGKDVSKRLHDTFLGLVVKAARGVGVTPWLLLAKGNTMQSRLNQGGGIRVTRLSAHAARVEVARCPLMAIPYQRHALLGVYAAGVELLASHVSARILASESENPGHLTVLRLDWR